jgi:hypothetical protein
MVIAECERRGIALTLGETSDVLAFDAPAGALTLELRCLLAEHKGDIIQTLFEREERAAVQGAPEWADASVWQRGTTHPCALVLLDKLAPLGLVFVSVTPMRRRESEAA